jgi:hypothetical protein
VKSFTFLEVLLNISKWFQVLALFTSVAACLTVMFCSLLQFFVVQVNRYVVNWCLGEVFYLPLGPVDHPQVACLTSVAVEFCSLPHYS